MTQVKIIGKFADINDKYIYYVEIGDNTLNIREIQDGDIDEYEDGEIICFTDESPVTLSIDYSDTFEHVYMRSCSISLTTNFDIRKWVVAQNYTDIPVIVKWAEIGVNDDTPVSNWEIVFDGYVNPLSFNQPYARTWNSFTLECTDRLGILQYKKFADLLSSHDYATPRTFINLALSPCSYNNINYSIENDHTQDTKINPKIFIGESEDEWMTCLEVLNEIGKVYGFYIFQENDYCVVKSMITNDGTLHVVQKDEYMSDDANISIDDAYNVVKCTVDISNLDETFINPFDEEYNHLVGKKADRIMTEVVLKTSVSKANKRYDTRVFMSLKLLYDTIPYIKNWSSVQQSGDNLPEIYEHYGQIVDNSLFTFPTPNYMDPASLGGGGGNGSHEINYTFKWLKDNPGKGAFVSIGKTGNIINPKDNGVVSVNEMSTALVIQVGGHDNASHENTRLSNQIYNNMPVCSFSMTDAVNLIPNDMSVTNWLVISGKMLLNPVQPKTGISWGSNKWLCSQNTIDGCITNMNQMNWHKMWGNDPDDSLWNRALQVNGDVAYYQNYTWENITETVVYPWPYNQDPVIDEPDMFNPILSTGYKRLEYEGCAYDDNDDVVEFDNISKVPIIACEMKIGDKYLTENTALLNQYRWYMPAYAVNQIYSWKTAAEAAQAGLNTYFTIGINPKIGDFIVGQEYEVQNTVSIDMQIDAKGFAIPIPYTAGLTGAVSFKILGPVNLVFKRPGKITYKTPFYDAIDVEGLVHELVLACTENIVIKDLKFKLYAGGSSTIHDYDNDLVYCSDNNDTYTEDKEFDCKFCTALTQQEVDNLGIDYKANNSTILNLNNEPWYGMSYGGQSGVKLEEARVKEQYDIWKKPRNLIEVTLKEDYFTPLSVIDGSYNKFGFSYLSGTYVMTTRDSDLKQNTMTCTFKDMS